MILSNMWFQKLIRTFFFTIDKIVFNFIPIIYKYLIDIARTSILTQADILDMADRIYKLLAVFMVFKVTFSLIMYVVNPDDFSDKTKGLSKLGTNVIFSLALLIITPYLFSYAYQLQTYILEDNSLATLILGKKDNEDTKNNFNTAGETMAYITISPFFTPDSSLDGLFNCGQLTVNGNNGEIFNEECSGIDSEYYSPLSTTDTKNSLYSYTDENSEYNLQTLKNYVAGVNARSFGLMFREDMVVATAEIEGKETFIMDYKFIISTCVGVITALILITFCMDVALRSIKLAFLQLIAPIPIISYVDPKSGKDGMFKKWYQMCFKTYLSLFLRLLALYFAVYIISRIDSLTDIIDGSYKSDCILKVFVVIGALMFAKQLPKILEGLGIKLDGDGKFTLNPFKKFENEALGGKKILGATKGLAAGAMVGTAGMLTGAGLGRGLGAMFGGVKDGLQGKKFGEIRKNQATRNAEMRRAIASGSTFWGRRGAEISSYFGTPGALGRIEHDKIATQNRIDNLTAQKESKSNEIAERKRIIANQKKMQSSISGLEDRAQSKIKNGEGDQGKEYLKRKAKYEALKNDKNASAQAIADAEFDMNDYLINVGMKAYMTEQVKYSKLKREHEAKKISDAEFEKEKKKFSITDDAFDTIYKDYVANAKANGLSDDKICESGDKLHTQLGTSKGETADIQRSIDPIEREISEIDDEIKGENEKLHEYNAQEKMATSNVEATHATKGGPSDPNSIKPVDSTVGRRSYGPGTGNGPFGPFGQR